MFFEVCQTVVNYKVLRLKDQFDLQENIYNTLQTNPIN
jgi:hypothetical protein